MAIIIDNLSEDRKFWTILQSAIREQGVSRVDFCVGYFNLRGWDFIADEIDRLTGCDVVEGDDGPIHRTARLLIGMQETIDDEVRRRYGHSQWAPDSDSVQRYIPKIVKNFREQICYGSSSRRDEETLRTLRRQMEEGKVCVKLHLRHRLHAKLYLAHNPGSTQKPVYAYLGSSNLTTNGLSEQGELNISVDDTHNDAYLAQWFNDRWNDHFSIDITQALIQVIDQSWASEKIIPPYHIYLRTAYLLSQDARTSINEYILPPIFRHELFEFQQTAVKIAAKHLDNEKRGGAMIGDVVGLGKTITACAVAKLFEQRYYASTLIICPANLKEMWEKYIAKYDLKADVISMSSNIDVENMKYYRLVVIDESHNLRNSEGKRYNNIKDLLRAQDNKVLLLTATPYNKDFRDLANQLRLFVNEDSDLGIRPEEYIKELDGERNFMREHSEIPIRSIRAFEKSNKAEDWRSLMKLFLIRRTRTFIKENYAKTDEDNGRKYLEFPNGKRSYFPDRVPCAVKIDFPPEDQFSRLYNSDMVSAMGTLILPRYALSKYMDPKKVKEATREDKNVLEGLKRSGQHMIGFCLSNFFKRMDSSGYSYLLSLYRHILRNMLFLYAIENGLKLPIADENALPDDFMDDEDENTALARSYDMERILTFRDGKLTVSTDEALYMQVAREYYDYITEHPRSNMKLLDPKYFKKTLTQSLRQDCATLFHMIELCGEWDVAQDKKLEHLRKLIMEEHPGDKVLIFSQYSDTAEYVAKHLERRGVRDIACVTGNSPNITELVEQFSPHSNNVEVPKEKRVLVATDVLSEGQNLQDAHIIINYDMPWAIIRLIQRVGRVDRIGQEAEKIMCYSFFPADGVEEIIALRKRLNDRINENAMVVGSDEIFFEGNEQNLRDLFNEKAGVLDESDDSEVDMASYAYQIWKNATDANPDLKKIIPNLPEKAYSTKENTGMSVDEGVITYAKTKSDTDMLTWVDKNERIVTTSQLAILRALECSVDTPALEPLPRHHELEDAGLQAVGDTRIQTSGILGSRFSTKFRVVTSMDQYMRDNIIFATQDLKEAVNQIYNYPMREAAKFAIGQMLRRHDPPELIADALVDYYKNNQLCVVDEEFENKEARVMCSLGIKNVDHNSSHEPDII